MNKAPELQDSEARRDAAAQDPTALWQGPEPAPPVLLAVEEKLDQLPLEERFVALCQLARAPSVFQRLAAYRWLAGLYLIDLRYEQRAKRVIAGGLKREEGLARERVKHLLKRC
ncbi:MAG TPA: hypothetical protein DD491_01025 [Halieaceae bacterium]|nr:hypothetical protein [Halieaceae bacterium]